MTVSPPAKPPPVHLPHSQSQHADALPRVACVAALKHRGDRWNGRIAGGHDPSGLHRRAGQDPGGASFSAFPCVFTPLSVPFLVFSPPFQCLSLCFHCPFSAFPCVFTTPSVPETVSVCPLVVDGIGIGVGIGLALALIFARSLVVLVQSPSWP